MSRPSLKNSLFLYSMHIRPAGIGSNESGDLERIAFAKENAEKLSCLLQVFGTKFVLEILGSMGATWGSSEILGLRVASNAWFWRPCAILVGIIFLLRWLNQLKEYIVEENIQLFPKRSSYGEVGEAKPLLASQYIPDWLRMKN